MEVDRWPLSSGRDVLAASLVGFLLALSCCASTRHADPRALAGASDEVGALRIVSYRGCSASIEESDRIREILVLLEEARPAVLETYGAEYLFVIEWRNERASSFYAAPHWIAPVQTGHRDAISGWRLRTPVFHEALTLALDHRCSVHSHLRGVAASR